MIDENRLIEDFKNYYMVNNDGTWNDAIDRCVYLARTAPKEPHDESCDECRFFDKHVDEYPCSHCCHCYTSKFQSKSGD